MNQPDLFTAPSGPVSSELLHDPRDFSDPLPAEIGWTHNGATVYVRPLHSGAWCWGFNYNGRKSGAAQFASPRWGVSFAAMSRDAAIEAGRSFIEARML